jgi:hypothetical protein
VCSDLALGDAESICFKVDILRDMASFRSAGMAVARYQDRVRHGMTIPVSAGTTPSEPPCWRCSTGRTTAFVVVDDPAYDTVRKLIQPFQK